MRWVFSPKKKIYNSNVKRKKNWFCRRVIHTTFLLNIVKKAQIHSELGVCVAQRGEISLFFYHKHNELAAQVKNIIFK